MVKGSQKSKAYLHKNNNQARKSSHRMFRRTCVRARVRVCLRVCLQAGGARVNSMLMIVLENLTVQSTHTEPVSDDTQVPPPQKSVCSFQSGFITQHLQGGVRKRRRKKMGFGGESGRRDRSLAACSIPPLLSNLFSRSGLYSPSKSVLEVWMCSPLHKPAGTHTRIQIRRRTHI